jgi:hypothetical protein
LELRPSLNTAYVRRINFCLERNPLLRRAFFGSWAFVTGDLLPCVRKFMVYFMAKLTRKQIKEQAKSIIASNPGGIRFSSLVDQIWQQNPETLENTIHGSVRNLEKQFPQEVGKPSRGLYTPIGTKENDTASAGSPEQIAPTTGVKVEPFAEWIENDLDEVTEVAALGGGGLKSKWGTPDVVGTYKKLLGNVIEFPVEIASAEIKIDPPELKIKRMRPWWLAFTVGVITAGEFVLLIGMYSRDGNVWLRWLDTNTTVTSRLDIPKTLTQVGSPTAGLPIASTDPQPTDGAPPTAALPIASADTHSNQLAEANKPVVQAEPAPATVTSSPPLKPPQMASVQPGTGPGSGPQWLSAQRGSAARQLDAEEIATLINRGRDSLKSGDLVSARLLLRRAAEAGSASAALMLGTTFDPLVIRQLGAIGVVPDVAQARQWYEMAVELGSDAASQRLAKLAQTGQ